MNEGLSSDFSFRVAPLRMQSRLFLVFYVGAHDSKLITNTAKVSNNVHPFSAWYIVWSIQMST
jgi:hypothetical protein